MPVKAQLTTKLTADISSFELGLRKATAGVASFGRNIEGKLGRAITSPITAIGAAITGALSYSAFESGIQGAISAGDELYRLSKTTTVSVQALAALKPAFKQAGLGSQEMGQSIIRMERSIFSAAKSGRSGQIIFRELGLNFRDLARLSPERQFQQIGEAINKLSNPAARIGASMQIFGRAGAQLLPVFEQIGETDFGKLSERAKLLSDNAELFHKVTISFGKAGSNLKSVFIGMAATLAPFLLKFSNLVAGADLLGIGKKIGDGIQAVAETLAGAIRSPMTLLNYLLYRTARNAAVFFGQIFNGLLTGISYQLSAWEFGIKRVIGFFKQGFGNAIGVVVDGFIKGFDLAIDWIGKAFKAALNFGETVVADAPGVVDKIKHFFADGGVDESFDSILDKWQSTLGVGKDWFGVGKLEKGMDSALSKLRKDGKEFIDSFTGAKVKKGGPFDPFSKFSGFTTTGGAHIQSSSLATNTDFGALRSGETPIGGFGSLTSGSLNYGAYAQSQLLRAGERRKFLDAQVASGDKRTGSTAEAFGAIRRGDHARQREYERGQLRALEGVDKSNDLLSQINNTMSQAWQ